MRFGRGAGQRAGILLFGMSLTTGIAITASDTMVVLALKG